MKNVTFQLVVVIVCNLLYNPPGLVGNYVSISLLIFVFLSKQIPWNFLHISRVLNVSPHISSSSFPPSPSCCFNYFKFLLTRAAPGALESFSIFHSRAFKRELKPSAGKKKRKIVQHRKES